MNIPEKKEKCFLRKSLINDDDDDDHDNDNEFLWEENKIQAILKLDSLCFEREKKGKKILQFRLRKKNEIETLYLTTTTTTTMTTKKRQLESSEREGQQQQKNHRITESIQIDTHPKTKWNFFVVVVEVRESLVRVSKFEKKQNNDQKKKWNSISIIEKENEKTPKKIIWQNFLFCLFVNFN